MEQVCAEGRGRTVLVIDPEPEIVDLLDHMLRALGYSVVRASSRVDAARLVGSVEIDLMIADEHSVVARADAAGMPILLLSGSMDKDACPAHILPKPFHFTELRDKVAAAIRRCRETRPDRQLRRVT